MWRFSISEHAVPPDAHLSWSHGSGNKNDDEDIAGQDEIYEKKSSKTVEFARSTDCVQNLVTCCVASIPRWDYARSLESKASDGGRSFGVVKERNSIFERTRNIIHGNDPLVEVIIADGDQPDFLRSLCVKSLLSSLLYVLYSDRKYTPTVRNMTRGEMDLMAEGNLEDDDHCCRDTGVAKKATDFARRADFEDNMQMRESFMRSLGSAKDIACSAGGFATMDAEGFFSEVRNIGIMRPFRSMMFSTALRELSLRWATRHHREHFVSEIKKNFGGLSELERLNFDRPSSMNSYTKFLPKMGKMPSSELNDVWRQIQGATKELLREDCLEPNNNSADEVRRNQTAVLKCDVSGPFGSNDVVVPFDANAASALLSDNRPDLRECWRRSNITERRRSLECRNPQYEPTARVLRGEQSVILDGELCKRHKRIRIEILLRLKNLRSALKQYYFPVNGLKHGVVFGLRKEGVRRWYDLILVEKKPELYLCVELSCEGRLVVI